MEINECKLSLGLDVIALYDFAIKDVMMSSKLEAKIYENHEVNVF